MEIFCHSVVRIYWIWIKKGSGTCWTWRELPDDYFPRILNELSCQEGDYCLSGDTVVFVELIDPSGWGQCQQQYRNVDVLRKVDGRWVPTTVTTATCCESVSVSLFSVSLSLSVRAIGFQVTVASKPGQ